ncbi:sn-glycerol-3-phosphate import ATP-binding protein UgpC [Cohaesibacter gelatinilyticus]|uniref:Carbohydrate ABC transporter ATP-binding protein, CUT1 family n=1 Tax=Cohaesibacter gelatinilyticus TaxID=372072 RepID=A0A285NBH0_9HYPH|nr:sn-glycerol-3-phosphate import ATP-binding protein UgpC [Cohaesibacter gelatinilyticus]SNZ06770.1 carbohydrate ABC transporter ATP-binding protein, CUT1 family [Cohaesibacter gelatinilyticus]
MAKIALEHIRKAYGQTQVIHGIDGEIEAGEFVVIVGPSGCGKSTLLRMIAGLETVTEGNIRIGDQIVNNLEPSQRDIAMVFQNYALYPHMSVFDNMSYGLKIRGLPKDEIKRRVEEAAKILELSPYLQRAPRQLSGGQRQRVAMGRAIVREPSVFLFDEPLSNLDAKLRVQMRLEIKKLQERLGITSVYVTHDQVEAMTLGHRLMVLNGGNVEQFGTPIDLYDKPQTLFVAGFIGSPAMNILDGVCGSDGQSVSLANNEVIPVACGAENQAGKTLKAGARPEHLHLSGSHDAQFTVTVDVVEQLGADTIVHGTLLNTEEQISVRLDGIQKLDRGTSIGLSVDPANVHLFDPETTQRVN